MGDFCDKWGIFEEKTGDFCGKWGIFKETMDYFRYNEGFSNSK